MRPTGRGWWVLALAATALVLGAWWRYPGLLVVGGALAAVTVVEAVLVGLTAHLTAKRSIEPLEVPRYAACTGTLTIVHNGRIGSVVAEGLEPVAGEAVPVNVGWLRPGRRFETRYPVPTERRGRLRVGPLRLRRYGPAGLVGATEFAGDVVDVRVLPRVLPVQAMPTGAVRGHVGAEERVAQGGTDLVGLREYVHGDDLRRVHWGTSARTGTLMVREDADPARPHLAVLLDDRAASYGDREAFEHAVEVAASLAWAAAVAGNPVRLRAAAGPTDIALDASLSGTARPDPALLAALADVSLVDGASKTPAVPEGDPDVLVVVTGPAADTAALALAAGRAQTAAVLAVDAEPSVSAAGGVVVLRAQQAPDVLASWDRTVSGRPR